MVEIQCLACDKTLKLPQFVNTDNYDGQVVCPECKALLHIKLVKSKVLKYKIIKKEFPQREPIKYVEIVKDYGEGQQPQTRTSKQ